MSFLNELKYRNVGFWPKADGQNLRNSTFERLL